MKVRIFAILEHGRKVDGMGQPGGPANEERKFVKCHWISSIKSVKVCESLCKTECEVCGLEFEN